MSGPRPRGPPSWFRRCCPGSGTRLTRTGKRPAAPSFSNSCRRKLPEAARPPKNQPGALLPTGRLLVRVLVRPDGSVRQPPRVTKRELARPDADYPPAALRALDAEAQRVLGALRFVRSKAVADSLEVPIRFIAE